MMASISDALLTFEKCPGCGHPLGDPGYLVVLSTQQGLRALPVCWNCASLMSSASDLHPQLRGLLDTAAVSRHAVWPLRSEWALARTPTALPLGQPALDHRLATIAYIGLHLDQVEMIDDAETLVAELLAATARPLAEIALLLDVIATPAQVAEGTAGALARHLIAFADTAYPDLHSRLVGVTDQERVCPARDGFVLRSLDWTALNGRQRFIVRS
jgi:hypothetical protein